MIRYTGLKTGECLYFLLQVPVPHPPLPFRLNLGTCQSQNNPGGVGFLSRGVTNHLFDILSFRTPSQPLTFGLLPYII